MKKWDSRVCRQNMAEINTMLLWKELRKVFVDSKMIDDDDDDDEMYLKTVPAHEQLCNWLIIYTKKEIQKPIYKWHLQCISFSNTKR